MELSGKLDEDGLRIRARLLARVVAALGAEKVEAAMADDQLRSLVNCLCQAKADDTCYRDERED